MKIESLLHLVSLAREKTVDFHILGLANSVAPCLRLKVILGRIGKSEKVRGVEKGRGTHFKIVNETNLRIPITIKYNLQKSYDETSC